MRPPLQYYASPTNGEVACTSNCSGGICLELWTSLSLKLSQGLLSVAEQFKTLLFSVNIQTCLYGLIILIGWSSLVRHVDLSQVGGVTEPWTLLDSCNA